MAHLMSITVVTQSSQPSSSLRGLGWTLHVSRTPLLMRSRSEVFRYFGDEIACVSTVRAYGNTPEISLTAPSLNSFVGGRSERQEIMSIADADAADQTSWLPTGENSGIKFSVKRRDVPAVAKRVGSDGAGGERGSSAWDVLTRVFETPSVSTNAIIEESGNSPAPWAMKGGAEPTQFVLVSAAFVFLWWLGNYYVPDMVFKNTVFRDQSKGNPLSGDGSTSEVAEEMPTAAGFAQTADRTRKKTRKSKRS